ncbi:MAG: porin [Solimonas sp.]
MIPFRKTALAAAIGGTLLACALPASAGDDASNATLLKLIRQQAEQIRQLEARLAAVEAQKRAAPDSNAAAPAAPEDAVAAQQATTRAQVDAAVADSQQSQLDALQAQVAQLAAGGGADSGNVRWTDGGPEFRSADGFFTFHPRGRVLLDFSHTDGSVYDARNISGTEGRDLRLGGEGSIGALSYKIDVDFSDQLTSVKDAWIEYDAKILGIPAEFTLGNQLKDRSIDGTGTLSRQPFMERNAVASVGSGVNGYYGLGGFVKFYGDSWHLGASITGDDLDNEGTDSDSIMYAVRAHWNPIKGAQGFVHVGSWYWYEKLASDVTTINNAPRIGQDFNDDLRVSASSIASPTQDEAWGYELGGVWRSFWAFGEYTKRTIDSATTDVSDRIATSIETGWLITGEKPGFSRRSGVWAGTKVLSPVTSGGWGGWELVTRFDRYDFRDLSKGGDSRSSTVGVNWYLNDWSRLMFDYVDWNTDNRVGSYQGPDGGKSIGVRAQVVW